MIYGLLITPYFLFRMIYIGELHSSFFAISVLSVSSVSSVTAKHIFTRHSSLLTLLLYPKFLGIGGAPNLLTVLDEFAQFSVSLLVNKVNL